MQPEMKFIEELKKPIHSVKPAFFKRKLKADEEIAVDGIYLCVDFPDEENLLDTAFDDFNIFLDVYEIKGNRYPIKIKKGKTPCFEAYMIDVRENECVVTASDTEGIRRALVYIEDEFNRREGPFLPKGKIERKPVISDRITRNFFAPTKRPPKNGDELFDDIDYYPDEYLNRLAHDGTNGLWIYTEFKELIKSDIITEYGEGSEIRLSKLSNVVKKCKKYGVKVFVFALEPYSLDKSLYEKYPDLLGGDLGLGHYAFCTNSERGEQYCIESMQRLFEAVPDLGGAIVCTTGERLTSCASWNVTDICPNCSKYTKGEVLAHTTDLLKEGIRRAGSDGEMISYTYNHRSWAFEDIEDYIEHTPSDIAVLEVFEDGGIEEQLGKKRIAFDYWLSYTGPSEMFKTAARAARKNGNRMFAKMQVCCSHELATVPYIPVPGILFDKYKAAGELGVSGVMQCWYFGNYPSLMSKAAGELAFETEFDDKNEFLKKLAGIYYGGSSAEEATKAWSFFEEGYKNYPINVTFSYYGPMHDGVVWELYLKPVNRPLPRTWMLLDAPIGDRIGECLQKGHTIEEARILIERIIENWEKGLEFLPENTPKEQKSVAEALLVLFKSGRNILEFYYLRAELGYMRGDLKAILERMKQIVNDEIQNSTEMISLCENDNRIGYHSESEGFKFFPGKLRYRIDCLKNLLSSEFTEVSERIEKGLVPLEYYLGDEKNGYKMTCGDIKDAKWEFLNDDESRFRVAYDDEKIYLELKTEKDFRFCVNFEYNILWPGTEIAIYKNGMELTRDSKSHQSMFGEKIDEFFSYHDLKIFDDNGHYLLTIDRNGMGWTKNVPFKMYVGLMHKQYYAIMTGVRDAIWKEDHENISGLGRGCYKTKEFGWLIP